jgi:hypothetical protein
MNKGVLFCKKIRDKILRGVLDKLLLADKGFSMIYKIVLLISLCLKISTAQDIKAISTKIIEKPDYYNWITILDEGPRIFIDYEPEQEDSFFINKDAVVSYSYRVIITTSEIYNSIYIEKVIFGIEGSNARISKIKKINMDEFQAKFKIKGEIAGFELEKWINEKIFLIKRNDRKFKFSAIDQPNIIVEEIY